MEDDTIETVEIANGPFRAQLLTIGASLRKLEVPGRSGSANVVLGYRDLEEYRGHPRFYGAVAGRYANRIGGAKFSLDGKEFNLPRNSGGADNLHSGPGGLDQAIWRLKSHDAHKAVFTHTSKAGANGFPGNLEVETEYALERDGLSIVFRAVTDAPTVVNITHHAYFNLAGEGSGKSILDQILQIPAGKFTPVDAGLIPTGVLQDVTGPLDFRTPKPVGRDIGAADEQLRLGHGYDHNWVIDAPAGRVRRVATLFDPGSGRVLEVHSCQPGVQFYSGNHLANGAPGTTRTYGMRDGLCLEPQRFPDSPNKPQFPSTRLDPGQVYTHKMAFRFRVAKDVAEAFPS